MQEHTINGNKHTVGFVGGKFLPLHLGHVYLITTAASYVDELYVILSSYEIGDRRLCERDGIRYMPPEVRLSWLGQEFHDIENIKILHSKDDRWGDDYDWAEGSEEIKKMIGKPIDYIFTSEHSYDKYFKKSYPQARHIVLDSDREAFKVSGTQVRQDLYKYWDMLPDCVRSYFTKKVAVIGTESCGKSTLAKKLAKIYNASYIQEVGREYCERYSDRLTPGLFDVIAMEHYLLQDKKLRRGDKIIFVDSEATITQYYLDMYFNETRSPFIDALVKLQDYDLVIYLEPDVKWVDDGFRFAGADEVRMKNNAKLKKMFEERNIPFVSISGTYAQRFSKARSLVDKLFESKIVPLKVDAVIR
jgi:HTH-type transcriptional repressor of NAD biosynthesis genes